MDLVFDDDDMTVVCLMGDQFIGGLKGDIVDIAPECGHQACATLDGARPTRDFVEDLVNEVIGDDVEEVLAINKVAQRPSNQVEVRVGALVGSDFGFGILDSGGLRRRLGLNEAAAKPPCPPAASASARRRASP